ncbi:MAG: twin-arginine translocase TatA/TatE family subunit [bacterium]|nr:twin-arginine translocase TatA/TatE family subunit [bacterium]
MFGIEMLETPFVLAMFGLGTQELLIFMVIVLIIFGSARLPSLMRNLGRSANEFKAGMRDPIGDSDDSEKEKGKE